jgi:hypothetical protein
MARTPFQRLSTSMSHVQPEGEKTLEHLYSTQRDAYKVLSHPPFGNSDHNSILRIREGLKYIMDHKGKPSRELPSDASLPDELNAFYASF